MPHRSPFYFRIRVRVFDILRRHFFWQIQLGHCRIYLIPLFYANCWRTARLAIIKCLLRNIFYVLRFFESYPKICNYHRTSQETIMLPNVMGLSEKPAKSKAMPVSALFIFSARDGRRCYKAWMSYMRELLYIRLRLIKVIPYQTSEGTPFLARMSRREMCWNDKINDWICHYYEYQHIQAITRCYLQLWNRIVIAICIKLLSSNEKAIHTRVNSSYTIRPINL
jgi:hypothetical protein